MTSEYQFVGDSVVIRRFYNMTGRELLAYWDKIKLDTNKTLLEWLKEEADLIRKET